MGFENIVRIGKNAGNQHFLLSSQCFLVNQRQKSSFAFIVIEKFKCVLGLVENIVGKGENAGY